MGNSLVLITSTVYSFCNKRDLRAYLVCIPLSVTLFLEGIFVKLAEAKRIGLLFS